MPDAYAARAEEFNRLLIEQGFATRSMKTGWRPDEEQRGVLDTRAARLIELAELMGPRIADAQHQPFSAEAYVNERIAAWLRANPLGLTNRQLAERLASDESQGLVSVYIGMGVERKNGYAYTLLYDDLRQQNGLWQLHVPDSVAEFFRQQGRRQVQREIADVLALKSHL
jgi:hypothetical protein